MIRRALNPLRTDSFFLFGARGTGKSTFVEEQFLTHGSSFRIDLLDSDQEERYARDPKLLEKVLADLTQKPEWVFIDEVQKVPKLLDHVHRLIEKKKQKFILSGSSARKLKRHGVNLLAGRAFLNQLYPLTRQELGANWNLEAEKRPILKVTSRPTSRRKSGLSSLSGIWIRFGASWKSRHR